MFMFKICAGAFVAVSCSAMKHKNTDFMTSHGGVRHFAAVLERPTDRSWAFVECALSDTTLGLSIVEAEGKINQAIQLPLSEMDERMLTKKMQRRSKYHKVLPLGTDLIVKQDGNKFRVCMVLSHPGLIENLFGNRDISVDNAPQTVLMFVRDERIRAEIRDAVEKAKSKTYPNQFAEKSYEKSRSGKRVAFQEIFERLPLGGNQVKRIERQIPVSSQILSDLREEIRKLALEENSGVPRKIVDTRGNVQLGKYFKTKKMRRKRIEMLPKRLREPALEYISHLDAKPAVKPSEQNWPNTDRFETNELGI